MTLKTQKDEQAQELASTGSSTDTGEPSEHARLIYGRAVARRLGEEAEAAYESKVLSTPGLLEALDSALDELEAMKRSL